ncbi:putative amidohydrolase family protein [Phaeomoniella chlamydospora]|uniref:Putative amidohydrolase family protein n=1 Tax=Phaeomoniella chlamydospora TaxID=158046 RepID=A0A0G2F478_PHACM|nr:putative amidohydrolase family protein [Phaeomoniella chlamydospora]
MTEYPIVDSHIHLYPESHIKTLAWGKDLPSGHPLNQQQSVTEYKTAAETASDTLKGFVFLETDRISQSVPSNWSDASASDDSYPDPPEWKHPLDEISYLSRIAIGQPIENEGHIEADSSPCLAFIPWAPITAGATVLSKYHTLALSRCHPSSRHLLRGYRYLFQDKPAGTMLTPEVISSLQFLGRNNLTFDLGVDARQGGLHQLEEAAELLSRLSQQQQQQQQQQTSDLLPKIIINHLCKPDIRSPSTSQSFASWSTHLTSLSNYPESYLKLSGLFSELRPQSPSSLPTIEVLHTQIKPWTDFVFDVFGPKRIMFGSDWPVCNVGGGGGEWSWRRWRELVQQVCEDRGLTEDEMRALWAGTAKEAYGLEVGL